MKKIKIKKGICLGLIAVMALNSSAYASNKVVKEETVYVNLTADGTQKESIVSDWIQIGSRIGEVKDKTDLESIEVVKGESTKKLQGENRYIWDAKGEDIYYQGKTKKELPLKVQIRYFLDGEEITAQEIAGKSGKVQIRIKLINTDSHIKTIGGKAVVMYTPFTASMVVALPNDTFSDVECEHARISSDGNNQLITFIAMPGLKESLDWDHLSFESLKEIEIPDEMVIRATTEEFELKGIAIAASPRMLDLEKIKSEEDMDSYRQDVDQIRTNKEKIEKIDPNKQLQDIYKNSEKTKKAQTLTKDIFDFYELDKAILDILPDYVTHRNIQLYDRVRANVEEANLEYVLDNEVLRNLPDRMTDEKIEDARQMIDHYDEIQNFDMKRFDKVLDLLDDYQTNKGVADLIDKTIALTEKLEDNKDKLDTLEKFSKHSDQILELIDSLQGTGQGGLLTKEDVEVMLNALANHRANEATQNLESQLIASNGEIKPENRVKVNAIIDRALLQHAITSESAIAIKGAIQMGNVGDSSSPAHRAIVSIIHAGATKKAESTVNDAKKRAESLLQEVQIVQSDLQEDMGINYEQDIRDAIAFGKEIMPDVKQLREEKERYSFIVNKAKDMAENQKDIEYFHYWGHRIKEMKEDLDRNADTVDIARDMLQQYDDPKIKHFKKRLPVLRKDMDEIRPILRSLTDKLELPLYNKSFHASPKTITTLKKMKEDLEMSRDVTDSLKLATDDRTVRIAKDMIELIERYDREHTLDKIKDKVDNFDELMQRKDAIQELSDHYTIFTEAEDNMETSVKFVFKTDEIKKSKTIKLAAKQREEKTGLIQWIKALFHRN